MEKTMVSQQAFPSLLPSSRAPRVSVESKTPFPFPFKHLQCRLCHVLQGMHEMLVCQGLGRLLSILSGPNTLEAESADRVKLV